MATTTSGCDANRLTALARTLSSTYAFSPLCGREFHDELFSFQIEIRIPLDGLCEHTTRFCLYCAILDQPLALAGIMVASGRYTPPQPNASHSLTLRASKLLSGRRAGFQPRLQSHLQTI